MKTVTVEALTRDVTEVLGCSVLVSFDQRQRVMAARAGLRILPEGTAAKI
jgi:hypothetical protein